MGSEQTVKKYIDSEFGIFYAFSDLLPEIKFSRFCEQFSLIFVYVAGFYYSRVNLMLRSVYFPLGWKSA